MGPNRVAAVFADAVAAAVLEKYKSLGPRGKPSHNTCEWTVLAGIVASFASGELRVLSVATGNRCVGKSGMSRDGDVVHDCHAEVLARRAFLRYSYEQLQCEREDSPYFCNAQGTSASRRCHVASVYQLSSVR